MTKKSHPLTGLAAANALAFLTEQHITMKITRKTALFTLAITVAACITTLASAKGPRDSGEPSYNIIQLDDEWEGTTFFGGEARDINEMREVVGQVEDPVTGDLLAAYWSDDNQLQPLLGSGVSATGLNDLSEIVGVDDNEGLYWASPAAIPVPLSALTGDESGAGGINNDGVICGVSVRSVFGPDPGNPADEILLKRESRAVVWKVTPQGIAGPFHLPSLFDLGLTDDPNESNSVATAINENSQDGVAVVAGTFYRSQGTNLIEIAAVTWSVSFVTTPEGSLELAVTPTILDFDAFAAGVNDDGSVCGVRIGISRTEDQPVVWTETTSQLSGLPSVKYDMPTDINQNGVIVGFGSYEDRKTQGQRAVVWPSGSDVMILLDSFLGRRSPLVHLQSAEAVNNSGEIVGLGSGGAFLAIPR